MWKRLIYLLLSCLLIASLSSCSSDDDDGGTTGPASNLAQLADCTASSLHDIMMLIDEYCYVVENIDQRRALPPSISYDPESGAFSFNLDLIGDATEETSVSGSITPSDTTDLSDGIQMGEVITILWTMTRDSSPVGSGNFSISKLSNDVIRITIIDDTSFGSSTGCHLETTSFGIHTGLVGGEHVEHPFGSFEFDVDDAGDSLIGVLGIANGTADVATVSGTYKGSGYSFTIDLDSYDCTM